MMVDKAREGNFIAKGIIHCHTEFSYDSKISLSDLCSKLRHQGLGFVALTEHTDGVTPEDYEKFVGECQRESSSKFIAIPGLEIRCDGGIEIAGIGISKFVNPKTPSDAVSQIHSLGGYAILVHPLKRKKWDGISLDYDAIEILNGKLDGSVSPNLSLLRDVRKCHQAKKQVHAIFGLDSHDLEEIRHVWSECEVSGLTTAAIVESLHKGRFVSRVPNGKVSSSGGMTVSDFIKFFLLRAAFISWNKALELIPRPFKKLVIRLSRPLVKTIKQDGIN